MRPAAGAFENVGCAIIIVVIITGFDELLMNPLECFSRGRIDHGAILFIDILEITDLLGMQVF